jgi:lysyl-tRNA synthetase class I
MGTTMTQGPVVPHHGGTHTISTTWIPRAVRCPRCQELAREEVRERLSDDEVAVRYGCGHCRWHQTRHYHESELDRDEL